MVRSETPDSTTSTVAGKGESPELESLQCNEDLHMDGPSASERCSTSSPTSSAKDAMVRDLMSGARSGATSFESSPQSKGRQRARAGSERSERDIGSGLLSGVASEVPSEDEQWRKRCNGSVSSGSADAHDGDDAAGAAPYGWPKSMRPAPPMCPQLASPTSSSSAASSAGAWRASGGRECGGFTLLNAKSPSGGKVLSPQNPNLSRGGVTRLSLGGVPKKQRRGGRIHIVKKQAEFLPMPTRRSCVAQPFGLIKPSPTDGENTLKCINRMVRQTSLHTQREQLSCSSCTLSRGSRGVSPSSVTGGGIAMGTWASPPRIGGMVQADEVILQCNENLPIDDSLCLSPR